MQFLKSAFIATLLLGSVSIPSFASEEFSLGGNDAVASSDVDALRDRGNDRGRGGDRGRDWDRRRPRAVTCFARNVTGRTFSARDFNANRAQSQAMRACRSRSLGPIGASCRPAGCR